MGLFSFLKKLGKQEEVEEIVLEKLAFSEIENWLDKKIDENKIKEEEVLVLVQKKIKDFSVELQEKIVHLNEFDVESKKAKDKIKGVVEDSRIKYVGSLEKLIASLENINVTKYSEITKKIDKLFLEFNKGSSKNYELVTILIGKEMADIRDLFKNFSNALLEIFNENKEIPELFKKYEFVKLKCALLNSIKNKKIKVRQDLLEIQEKIKQKKEERQDFLKKIGEIKESEDYQNMLDKKEKVGFLEKEIGEKLVSLKQLIDFKALTNFFHINEDQMNVLKKYKENFQESFKKENGEEIIALLDEAKLNNSGILEKVDLVKIKREELVKCKNEIIKDETLELEERERKIVVEIEEFRIEKVKEDKRMEILNEEERELKDLLNQEFLKMNVEIGF
jgi:hypothetical protein